MKTKWQINAILTTSTKIVKYSEFQQQIMKCCHDINIVMNVVHIPMKAAEMENVNESSCRCIYKCWKQFNNWMLWIEMNWSPTMSSAYIYKWDPLLYVTAGESTLCLLQGGKPVFVPYNLWSFKLLYDVYCKMYCILITA